MAAGQENVETLRAEINQLKDDLSGITSTLKELARETGSSAYERVREHAGRARDESERLARGAVQQVEERPLTSLLVAFVMGLVLGVVFSRRS